MVLKSGQLMKVGRLLAVLVLGTLFSNAVVAASTNVFDGQSASAAVDLTTNASPASALSAGEQTQVSTDNGVFHLTAASQNGRFVMIRLEERIDDPEASVTQIDITWNGTGINSKATGNSTDGASLYVWNYSLNAGAGGYELLGSFTTENEETLSASLTANLTDYIGGGSDDLIVVLVSTNSKRTGNQDLELNTDLIEVNVTAGGGPLLDHFVIVHDNLGINCLTEIIEVTPYDSSDNVVTAYSETITLDTQTGNGSWVATSGDNSVIDAVADDGLASYTFSGTETFPVTFSLSYTQGVASFDVDVFQSDDSTLRDDDTEGNIRFAPDGFTVTQNILSNPVPNPINDPVADQVAGTTFNFNIAAFGQTATDPECGIIEAYDGPMDINFWVDYVNPGTGSVLPTLGGTAIAASEGGSVSQSVSFVSGQAQVPVKYKDVGDIQINLKDATDEPLNVIRGSTNNFVVKPSTLAITQITRLDLSANPAAADADGDVFVKAGEAFVVNLEVRDAEGDRTPNFGNESSAEGVRVDHVLVAPVGGDNGTLANQSAFTATAPAGTFVNSTLSWSEVGILGLTPHIDDGDYLGAGDVVGGASGNVGRFYPDRFVASNGIVTESCSGGFTYMGDNFDADYRLTAVNVAGDKTLNYRDDFIKLNATLGSRDFGAIDGSGPQLLSSRLVEVATIYDWASGAGGPADYGVGDLSSNLVLAKALVVDGPLQASIGVLATDEDGVTFGGASLDLDVDDDTVNDHYLIGVSEQRFGRLAVNNAYGPEMLALAVPMQAEYYNGSKFVINNDDTCTSLIAGQFDLAVIDDDLLPDDSNDPAIGVITSIGVDAGTTDGTIGNSPFLGGLAGFEFSAPGLGNSSKIEINIDLDLVTNPLPWLKFDWKEDGGDDNPPLIEAVFGSYRGNDRVIYWREKF